jgi:acyl-CoA thioesterase I
MRYIYLLVALLFLTGAHATHTVKKETVIVAFGDSLTKGYGVSASAAYPAQLQQMLRADGHKVRVYTVARTGATTADALDMLPQVLKLKPNVVIVSFGFNDAAAGIPAHVSKQHLEDVIEKLQDEGIDVILAGMDTGVRVTYEGPYKEYLQPYLDYATNMQETYADLAEEHGTGYVPFLLSGVAGNTRYNQRDYVHPNRAGHKLIARTLTPVVAEYLPKRI